MRTFLVSILCLCSFSLFAQQFSGYRAVKIGFSERDFISNIEAQLGKITRVTKKNTSKIQSEWYKLEADDTAHAYKLDIPFSSTNWPNSITSLRSQNLSEQPDTFSFYYLPHYPVGNVIINNVYAIFKSGILEGIESDYQAEIANAAKRKYPPSEVLDTSYSVECTTIMSGIQVDSQQTFIRHVTWKYSNLTVEGAFDLQYDFKCQPVPINYLKFYSTQLDYYIRHQTEIKLKKIKETEKSQAASILHNI